MSKLYVINESKIQPVTKPAREFNTVSGEEQKGNYYRIWYNSVIDAIFADKTKGFVKFKHVGNYNGPLDFKIYDGDNEVIPPDTPIPYGTEIRFEKNYSMSQKPQPRQTIAGFVAVYCPDENTEEITQPLIWKYL